MARADLLIKLVKAGSEGDDLSFRQTAEAIAAEERTKNHHQVADRLLQHLGAGRRNVVSASRPVKPDGDAGLFYEIIPRRQLEELILPKYVNVAVNELVEEQHRTDLLRSYNLEPRHRVLLAGPPGNGKTSLAEAIANALYVPLIQVRYEGLIGSFLGETAQRLKKLFDVTRGKRCVLFFDEFDAIAKERGDVHDTGEVKRVVSSLLMQMDELPSHVTVIVASNHPELLDRAVWRRFEIRLELPQPAGPMIEQWFRSFVKQHKLSVNATPRSFSMQMKGASFSDLELFGENVLRRYVLSLPNADLNKILSDQLAERKRIYKIK